MLLVIRLKHQKGFSIVIALHDFSFCIYIYLSLSVSLHLMAIVCADMADYVDLKNIFHVLILTFFLFHLKNICKILTFVDIPFSLQSYTD